MSDLQRDDACGGGNGNINRPQPGDIWERDGERREVVSVMHDLDTMVTWVLWDDGLLWLEKWMEWQSGATLVERKEPTP